MLSRTLLAAAIFGCGALMVTDLAQAQPRERSGEEIVKTQCANCHAAGLHGAPKIDDRAAWIPRMKNGIDATVRSAAKGHGTMPARGGIADLTDGELRNAIVYMFYPARAGFQNAAPAAAPDPNHRSLDGMDVYLGVTPARAAGTYHINISLRDAASKNDIRDAVIEARVSSPLGGTTKKLAPAVANGTTSYVNDFSMAGTQAYTIDVQVRRPGLKQPAEARFEFKP